MSETGTARQRMVLRNGEAEAFALAAGYRLRVTTPTDHQGGDFSFDGFDQSLTRNINGWERYRHAYLVFHLEAGMRMYDGDGKPVIEVAEVHSNGRIDIMLPGCWRELYDDGRPGCRDLISGALGIERSALRGMASFFVASDVTPDYYDALTRPAITAGDSFDLVALRPVQVAVSACPDVELPGWSPGELVIKVFDHSSGGVIAKP